MYRRKREPGAEPPFGDAVAFAVRILNQHLDPDKLKCSQLGLRQDIVDSFLAVEIPAELPGQGQLW